MTSREDAGYHFPMSSKPAFPDAVLAAEVPPRTQASNYPPVFAARMAGRTKRVLGDLFGIRKFGVNLTTLAPGAVSALLHKHTLQEEFVYILSGHPTLVTEDSEVPLSPGMCAGFSPEGKAHQLANRTDEVVTYLEIGDRVAGDAASYPADDLEAVMGENGKWVFRNKDGRIYD